MGSEPSLDSVEETALMQAKEKAASAEAPKAIPEDTSDLGPYAGDAMPLNPTGDQPIQFSRGDPNGDTKVEIGNSVGAPAFVGLGKDELMKFAEDPFWIRLRWFLFILFWICWAAMLAGAIAIIVLAPKCTVADEREQTVYRLTAGEFKLPGVKQTVDYLKDLNVGSVILPEILDRDGGAGTSNFTSIDPQYGTLEDLNDVVSYLHDKDIKVIMEININHCTKNCAWSPEEYPDYFVHKPKSEVENSVWTIIDGTSNAWSDDEESFLQQDGEDLLDLNYANPEVIDSMKEVLQFWKDQGIDGFLLSGVSYLHEDLGALENENATKNQPENINIIKSLVSVLLGESDKHDEKADMFVDLENPSRDQVTSYQTLGVQPIIDEFKAVEHVDGAVIENLVKELQSFSGNRMIKIIEPTTADDQGRKDLLVRSVPFLLNGQIMLEGNGDCGEHCEMMKSLGMLRKKACEDGDPTFDMYSDGGLFALKRSGSHSDKVRVLAVNVGNTGANLNLHNLDLHEKPSEVEMVFGTQEHSPGDRIDESEIPLSARTGLSLLVM